MSNKTKEQIKEYRITITEIAGTSDFEWLMYYLKKGLPHGFRDAVTYELNNDGIEHQGEEFFKDDE